MLRHRSYVRHGGRRQRDIALTFDDGPSPYTPRILRILRGRRAPATFFPIGNAVRAAPQLVRRELRAGFAVGNHTQTHPFLGRLRARDQRAEILGGARSLRAAGAPFPRLFRPPYGSFNRATMPILRRARALMVLWSVDTKDYSRPGRRRIVYSAVSGARPGAIILMHDGGGPRDQTVAALPRIISRLRQRRYRLVTVPQLLRENPPRRQRRR